MVQIISHRGGSFLWPENSLLAFQNSIELGAEVLECDVHLSLDGELVVIHDATLDRTTAGRGPVADRTAEELAATPVRGAGGEGVPRLRELLELVAPSEALLQVEIKDDAQGRAYPGALDKVLAELDSAGMRERAGIIVFEARLAAEAEAAGGLDHVAWLFDAKALHQLGLPGVLATSQAYGVGMVETHESGMTRDVLDGLRGAGLRVGVWGANHAPAIARMMSLGVDAIATDDPALAMRMRGG
ncbi:glycerophosphodiester phosphodiesterase [Muricoccus radiodurans]|uniref:glycerophosphodiester phosphodiesterase n=1 Tax=Muricoccus radiodurans TaxID=2231721 RepID=UPI003CFAC177